MRRILVVAGVMILLAAGIGTAYYESTHRFGGSKRGTSTEFKPSETVAAPQPGQLVSPMFGGNPQHLHVGVGKLRPPFRRDWVSGGTSLVEFPPAVGFHYLYYAALNGNLLAVSTRSGRRLWTVHVHRNRFGRGSVYETFLNRHPCNRGTAIKGDGELLAVAAGPSHKVRWKKRLGASETSPIIVGNQMYVGDADGNVYCLRVTDGKTLWTRRVGGAVKGAIAFDRGRLFLGAYDGRLYALRASDGKLIWSAESARDWFGGHGQFYSTPSVAYSRVYLGSTDGHVYSFGERSGKLRVARRLAGPRLRRLVRPHVLRLQRGDRSGSLEVSLERPDLGLGHDRRRRRLLRDARAAHVRFRRPYRQAAVDLSRRGVHARRHRRAAPLPPRLGEGVRLQSSKEFASLEIGVIEKHPMTQPPIELDLDGKAVPVPRELADRLAAAAAARAGVSAQHRDLSLLLARGLETGHASMGQAEVRVLCAVLEEELDRFGPAAAELLRAVA